MAVVRNRLTLAVAEVDDVLAKSLIESEQWDAEDGSAAPVARKRTPRKPAVEAAGE